MRQAAGFSSTAQLVEAYVTAEAANFELFNEVAGINAQAVQLQDLIVQQQVTIGRLRSGPKTICSVGSDCVFDL